MLVLTQAHQFWSFSSEAQKETFANLRLAPPTRATMCTSVMKDPSTVTLLPSRKRASSTLTLTERSGAEKKL